MQSEQELRQTYSLEFKSIENDEKSVYKSCYGEILPAKSQSQLINWNIEVFEQSGLQNKYSYDLSSSQLNFQPSDSKGKSKFGQEDNQKNYKSQLLNTPHVLIGNLHYMLKPSQQQTKSEITCQLSQFDQTLYQPLINHEEIPDQNIPLMEDLIKVDQQNPKQRYLASNIESNRLIKMKSSQRTVEKALSDWTWDTSAALIRLMIRNRKIRIFTNFYIWGLLALRVFYVMLILLFFLKNLQHLQNYTYFWTVFIVFITIRILFMLIVLKILTQGYKINDQKIKIVYQTYINILDQYQKQIENLSGKNQSAANKIRVRMYIRQILIIITPPEFSFIYVTINNKMQSGFYQVQNFIMKSLEVFFFIPFVVYFLNTEENLNINPKILPKLNWYMIASCILYSDLAIFSMFVTYLLFNNQRKINRLKKE